MMDAGMSLPAVGAVPKAGPADVPRPRVKVTEADKVAWMRHFLGALEAWKGCLDSLFDSESDPALVQEYEAEQLALVAAQQEQQQAIAQAQMEEQQLLAANQLQEVQLQQFQLGIVGTAPPNVPQLVDSLSGNPLANPLAGLASQIEVKRSIPGGPRIIEGFRPKNMCRHVQAGKSCLVGDNCMFAHHPDELRSSQDANPPSIGSTAAVLGDEGAQPHAGQELRLKKKKELCERFAQGYCSLGKVCAFAHGEDEIGRVGLAVVGNVKRELCRNWQAGRCPYTENCNNAHGEAEIGTRRPPPDLAPPMAKKPKPMGTIVVNVSKGAVSSMEFQAPPPE